MQPGTDHPGSRGTRDDDYAAGDSSRGALAKPVRRARIGLLVLLAFMTEIILIAAAANQAVTDNLVNASPRSVKGGLEESLETFAWRISPRSHDVFHVWDGSLALIGATVVLSLLLIFVVVRGPLTFGRAFFGTWMSVIVATMLGGYVRALVIDTPSLSHHGIPGRALFSSLAPGSTTFLAGVALGLIVALVVAIFGVVTRRPVETVAAQPADDGYADSPFDIDRSGGAGYEGGGNEGSYGPAGYGEGDYGRTGYGTSGSGVPDAAGPQYGATAYPGGDQPRGYARADEPTRSVPWQGGASDASETTTLPAMRAREPVGADDGTTTLPAVAPDARGAQGPDAPGDDAQTTALPRVAQESSAAPAAGDAQTTALPRDAQGPPSAPADRSAQATDPALAPDEAAHADPADAAPSHADPAEAAPSHADPAEAAPSHADPAGGPEQGSAQQTAQFPRPPDDEDLDPEHS